MIMPADAPRIAMMSGNGVTLRLEMEHRESGEPVAKQEFAPGQFTIVRAAAANAWVDGRAGMQYRDLIPGRLGGRCIASHIRIPDGGPVPDYVHYHKVGFQMIYCKQGWVRVVYEDQGAPFVMQTGDCVLQPPTIRHRVLDASHGLEVIEIGCPAQHETWRDHDLVLPTSQLRPERRFGGQHFVRHVAADAVWQPMCDAPDFITPDFITPDFIKPDFIKHGEFRDTGIADATDGLASVRVLRLCDTDEKPQHKIHDGEFLFLYVLQGRCCLLSRTLGEHTLDAGDACVIPAGADYARAMPAGTEMLEVAFPAISAARRPPA
jgi:quercetin dioxygenase-like cupin family protein